MFRTPQFFISILMLISLMATACGAGISTTEYDRVKSELIQVKTELDKTKDELNKLKSTPAGSTTAITSNQASSFEDILKGRRSVRNFANSSLTKDEMMKLLWAAQGITGNGNLRTAPSANVDVPPLRVYILANRIDGVNPGIYRYANSTNELTLVRTGDLREELANAMGSTTVRMSSAGGITDIDRTAIKSAPVNIVVTAIYNDMVDKYARFFGEERGKRYVLLEAGHATQNILIMATALNLGAAPMGGFSDDLVRNVMGIQQSENPLYIVPVEKK